MFKLKKKEGKVKWMMVYNSTNKLYCSECMFFSPFGVCSQLDILYTPMPPRYDHTKQYALNRSKLKLSPLSFLHSCLSKASVLSGLCQIHITTICVGVSAQMWCFSTFFYIQLLTQVPWLSSQFLLIPPFCLTIVFLIVYRTDTMSVERCLLSGWTYLCQGTLIGIQSGLPCHVTRYCRIRYKLVHCYW